MAQTLNQIAKSQFFTNFTKLDERIKLHYLIFIVEKIIKQLR